MKYEHGYQIDTNVMFFLYKKKRVGGTRLKTYIHKFAGNNSAKRTLSYFQMCTNAMRNKI